MERIAVSRKRTFTVHVNIDDMTAMLAGLDGPSEKADWLDGYMVGVHGHPSRETWPQPKRMGYDFGAKHFAEVEEFRAEQKRKSDLAEAAKNAQKNPEGTHGLPTGTGSGNPAGDPIQQSTNPLIQQPKEPTNEKPKRAKGAHSSEVLSIYEAYPRHDGPGACSKQIVAALEIEPFDSLLEATQAFCAAVRRWDKADQDQFTPMASTWFGQQRWMADRKTWERKTKTPKNGVQHNGFFETDYNAGLDGVPKA